MKRFKYVVMLLLGMGIFAMSCQKEDNISSKDYKEAIIGTWQVVKYERYMNGKLEKTRTPKEEEFIVFTNTGKCLEMTYGGVDDYQSYSVSGDELTMDEAFFKIVKLTEQDLVILSPEDDYGCQDKGYFVRFSNDVLTF